MAPTLARVRVPAGARGSGAAVRPFSGEKLMFHGKRQGPHIPSPGRGVPIRGLHRHPRPPRPQAGRGETWSAPSDWGDVSRWWKPSGRTGHHRRSSTRSRRKTSTRSWRRAAAGDRGKSSATLARNTGRGRRQIPGRFLGLVPRRNPTPPSRSPRCVTSTMPFGSPCGHPWHVFWLLPARGPQSHQRALRARCHTSRAICDSPGQAPLPGREGRFGHHKAGGGGWSGG
jgi:hypothetical protein